MNHIPELEAEVERDVAKLERSLAALRVARLSVDSDSKPPSIYETKDPDVYTWRKR